MTDEKHNMTEKQEEKVNPLPFEKTEETKVNPGEEVTPEEQPQEEPEEAPEETPQKETETPKKETTDYTDREKQYYARMKKAEEDAKKAKEALAKKSSSTTPDVDAILEVQSATKDMDAEEVAELKLRSSSLSISLSEARENPNFQLWQTAHREAVEKEKALNPSTTQSEVEEKETKTIDQRFQEIQEKYKGDNDKIQEENAKVLAELQYNNPITKGTVVGMNPIRKLDH